MAQYLKLVVVLCLWLRFVRKYRVACSILPNSNKATSPRSRLRRQDLPKIRIFTMFRLGIGFVSIVAFIGLLDFL